MNEKTSFPVHDPDPWWFYPMWAAAAVATVVISGLMDLGFRL